MIEDNLLTVNETAKILKVHQLTIRRYIKTGKLKAYKIAGNVRLYRSSIELQSNSVGAGFSVKAYKFNKENVDEFNMDDSLFRLKGTGSSLMQNY